MIEINPKNFYTIGVVCFGVIALMSVVGYIATFNILPWYGHIQKIAGIVFNFALIGFFFYFLKLMGSQQNIVNATDDEMKQMMEELI